MIPPFDLDRFLQQVSDRIGYVGNFTISRPTDASHLDAIPSADLKAACSRHRLNVVRRMAGSAFEFTRRAV